RAARPRRRAPHAARCGARVDRASLRRRSHRPADRRGPRPQDEHGRGCAAPRARKAATGAGGAGCAGAEHHPGGETRPVNDVIVPRAALVKRGRTFALGATLERLAVPVGAAAAIAALASANGGFFPVSWGWSSLAFCWVIAVGLALRPTIALRWIEVRFLVALAGL